MTGPNFDLFALRLGAAHPTGGDELLGGPIVSKNVGEQLAERLVTAVALGLYVPGQRLPSERELAGMVGVSRTGVREAIHILSDAGYVEIRRGRQGGAYVRADWQPSSTDMIRRYLLPNWEQFEGLLDARLHLEATIASLAAQRRSDEDLERMRSAVTGYQEARDREASRAADQRLHLAIVESTKNPVFSSLSVQLRSLVSLNLGAEPFTPGARADAKSQHVELVDAIEARDTGLAARIAHEHYLITDRLLRRLVARVTDEAPT